MDKIDPSTLDSETKQRLEAIIDSIDEPRIRFRLQSKLGNPVPLSQYFKVMNDIDVHNRDSARALSDVQNIIEILDISDGERNMLISEMFSLAVAKKPYDMDLRIAEVAGLPEEEIAKIRVQKLHYTMDAGKPHGFDFDPFYTNKYIDLVKEASQRIPKDMVIATAEQAYEHLMENERGHYGGTNYLRAGLLAKEYGLGRDKVLEAGRKLIEHHFRFLNNETYVQNAYEIAEVALFELDLPEEMGRPLMVRYFEQSLQLRNGMDQNIAKRHQFTDEDLSEVVNQVYTRFMQTSELGYALRLRQLYPTLIQDKVSIEDLRTIVGIMHHQ